MTAIELLEGEQTTELLRAALSQHIVGGAELTVLSSQELTAAAGRRRVIQYTVAGLDAAGPVLVIAKTFAESARAQLLAAHLQALTGGPFAVGRFRVPELLAYLPDDNVVVYRACTGKPLSELGDDEAALVGVRDAARWLATLHQSAVQLPRSFDVQREVESAHTWAATIGRHRRDVVAPAERLAANWASGLVFPEAQVPIHKDFHAGHVLIDNLVGGDVSVIDLDEARLGDRAFDLAHFCTYLELSGDGGNRRKAFLQEYELLTGWADHGCLARYAAYTWLKIAKQLAIGSGPYRNRVDHSGWTAENAVARGLACLAR